MSVDAISVFDLSPAEKLQLVEDLWDDLAASPSGVPVHEWQKAELARRKANLMSNPATFNNASIRLDYADARLPQRRQ